MIIERAFIIALLLSISGFVFCAIFLPFEKYAYKLTSAKTMVFANTAALFSFVIPLYFVVAVRDGSESSFVNYDLLVFEGTSKYDGLVSTVRELAIIEYLGTFWLIGVAFFLTRYVCRYARLIHSVRKNMFFINDDLWYDRFCRMKKEKKISKVMLIGCCSIFTPCTIGVRNRYIVIPAYMINSFDEDETKFILEHEFYHVTHRDLTRKLLITLLNCLNWFNPLYYFLRNNLSDWMEASCDEDVTKNFSKGQRKKYCQLIIKVLELERSKSRNGIFSIRFAGLDVKNYKRRMMKIMRKNGTSSMLGKVTVASVLLISMVSGNVIAKAADGPVNKMFSKNVEIVEAGEIEEVDASEIMNDLDFQTDSFANTGEFVEFVPCDTNDITYEIIYNGETAFTSDLEQGQIEPQHVHNIVDITLKEHKKNSDGSCKTTYYEGRKCTVCGLTWKGDKIGETTMVKCNH